MMRMAVEMSLSCFVFVIVFVLAKAHLWRCCSSCRWWGGQWRWRRRWGSWCCHPVTGSQGCSSWRWWWAGWQRIYCTSTRTCHPVSCSQCCSSYQKVMITMTITIRYKYKYKYVQIIQYQVPKVVVARNWMIRRRVTVEVANRWYKSLHWFVRTRIDLRHMSMYMVKKRMVRARLVGGESQIGHEERIKTRLKARGQHLRCFDIR